MADRKLVPKTAINRGPPGEEPIELDPNAPQTLESGAGDSSASDMDSNVGGAFASAGLDSGGAVGVRRGVSVGRPGFEYEETRRGETTDDLPDPEERERSLEDVAEVPAWANAQRPQE